MTGFLPLLFIPAVAKASLPPLSVGARAGVIVDAKTGKVLWQKDADEPLYPASTTKVMTALLLLEKTSPDELIVAPPDIDKVQPSIMHLKPGEKITAHDLLYGMMLRSANDACVAAAVHVAGSVPAFAELMNARAREIGCENTTFHNPNGLPDPLHKTTARDLAMIGREAMRRPDFQRVVRTERYRVTRSLNQSDLWMVNKNKWLRKDPSADGIKTGFTTPAGQCYVGSATRNGFRVIDTILKSKTWQADHGAMLNWVYANYQKIAEFKPGEIAGEVAIREGTNPTVLAIITTNEYMVGRRGQAAVTKELEPLPDLVAPIKKKQRVGYMNVTDEDGFTYRFPVFAAEDVPQKPQLVATGNSPAFWVVGAMLAGGWAVTRRNLKRRVARNRFGTTQTRTY